MTMPGISNSEEQKNAVKAGFIQADLETGILFAKLALQSDSKEESTRNRLKACEAYEEALHCLSTASLTQIEFESIRTKIERLESVLAAIEQTA
jgi:hypothetical protein